MFPPCVNNGQERNLTIPAPPRAGTHRPKPPAACRPEPHAGAALLRPRACGGGRGAAVGCRAPVRASPECSAPVRLRLKGEGISSCPLLIRRVRVLVGRGWLAPPAALSPGPLTPSVLYHWVFVQRLSGATSKIPASVYEMSPCSFSYSDSSALTANIPTAHGLYRTPPGASSTSSCEVGSYFMPPHGVRGT